jgi:hypothetical protein
MGILPRIVVICDLCPGGLGVLTNYSPPVGALLPLWLPGGPGKPSALVLVRVIHVQNPADEGLYRVGVACHDDHARTALAEVIARYPENE